MGSQDARAGHHPDLCLFQIRLVLSPVQLCGDHARRGPARFGKGQSGAQAFVHTAAQVLADAGRQFNRGQRAFFFALAYLGWFIGPLPFMVATVGVVVVMWRRRFGSDAQRALEKAVQQD
jgi:Predicted membrane protein